MIQFSREKIIQLLTSIGAIITNNHFVYTSGKHGDTYINKDAIYPHIKQTLELCAAIAQNFIKNDVEVVIGPALGGIILSQWTTYFLSKFTGREVLSLYAEKSVDGNTFIIKRGYDKLIAGKNVLIVEDVLTTGGSVKKVIDAVRAISGNVVGVGALCNRGKVTIKDLSDVPELFALIEIDLKTYDEVDCPLCIKKIPINQEIGKGREFIIKNNI